MVKLIMRFHELTDGRILIDGHDLKWKVFTCEAQNRVEAISKMREMFGANFEHRIAEVFRVEDQEV